MTLQGGRLLAYTSDFFWLSFGNLIYGLCQWAAILVIARLGTPDMVGQFSMAQAITVPIVLFCSLQLRVVQVADQRGDRTFGEYLSVRLLSSAAGMLIAGAVLAYLRAGWQTTAVVLLLCTAHTSAFVSDIYLSLYQQHRVMIPCGASSAVRGMVSTTALAVTLYATRSLVYAVAAFSLGCVAVLVLWDRRAPAILRLPPAERCLTWRRSGALFAAALPLGIAILLSSFNANVPRYFVHSAAGDRGLGIFSALASVQAAGFLLVTALGQVIVPPLARAYDLGDLSGFRRLVSAALAVLTLACGAGISLVILFGDRIVAMVFGAAYTGQNRTLVVLTASASLAFASSILSSAATAAQKLIHQAKAMAAVTVTTTVLCYFLVPPFAGFGAAVSGLISSSLSFGLMGLIVWRQLSDRLRNLECRASIA